MLMFLVLECACSLVVGIAKQMGQAGTDAWSSLRAKISFLGGFILFYIYIY